VAPPIPSLLIALVFVIIAAIFEPFLAAVAAVFLAALRLRLFRALV
jgi:hypothetical protein